VCTEADSDGENEASYSGHEQHNGHDDQPQAAPSGSHEHVAEEGDVYDDDPMYADIYENEGVAIDGDGDGDDLSGHRYHNSMYDDNGGNGSPAEGYQKDLSPGPVTVGDTEAASVTLPSGSPEDPPQRKTAADWQSHTTGLKGGARRHSGHLCLRGGGGTRGTHVTPALSSGSSRDDRWGSGDDSDRHDWKKSGTGLLVLFSI
jgi:hypothetical protein